MLLPLFTPEPEWLQLDMEKLPRSQVAKGVFLLILLLFIPFISPSLRTSYLYFLLNILIVALGLEAGLLNFISRPPPHHHEEIKKLAMAAATPIAAAKAVVVDNATTTTKDAAAAKVIIANPHERNLVHAVPVNPAAPPKPAVVQKKVFKVVASPRAEQALKRCPSRPSLFFIGGPEGETSVVKEEEEEAEEKWKEAAGDQLSKQELFAKAEAFIGNFYMQLKMQREESWKKIHGFYHRAL